MKDVLISSSVLIATVCLIRFAFRGRISRRLQYALWALVLLRLLIPVSLLPEAPFSVMSGAETLRAQVAEAPVSSPAPAAAVPISHTPAQTASVEIPFTPAPDAGISTEIVLKAVYLAGAGAVLAWFLVCNLRMARRLRRTRRPCAADCPIPVYVSGAVVSPCLFGLWRPAVYLTPQAADRPDAMDHVLTHELCHYRHGDHIWSALRCLCLAMYWFDPLVWLAAVLSRADGELACDEAAIRRLGDAQRLAYGRTLVDMVAVRKAPAGLLCTATTMASGARSLKARLRMIVRNPKAALSAMVAVVLIAAIVTGCTFTAAPSDAPDEAAAGSDAANTLTYVPVPDPESGYDCWRFTHDLDPARFQDVRLWAEVWTDGQMEIIEEPAATLEDDFLDIGIADAEEDGARTLRLRLGGGTDMGAMSTIYKHSFPEGDFPARGNSWLGGASDEQSYEVTPDRPVVLACVVYQPAEQDQLSVYDCSFLSDYPEYMERYAFGVVFKAVFTSGDAEDYAIDGLPEGPIPEDEPAAPAVSDADGSTYTASLIQGGEESIVNMDRDLMEDAVFDYMVRSAAWPNDQPVDGYPFAIRVRQKTEDSASDFYFCRRPDGRAICMDGSMYSFITEDVMQRLETAAGLSPGAAYDLDTAIDRAILSENVLSRTKNQCSTAAHTLLGQDVYLDDSVTAYVYGLYSVYAYRDGLLEEDIGGGGAMAFTFSRDPSGAYVLEEAWRPREGSYYAPDVREKFPENAAEAALNGQSLVQLLSQTCHAQAVAGLGIDGRAAVASLVDTICQGGHTDAMDCIDAHTAAYRDLVLYGDDAVEYAVDQFLNGEAEGVRGWVLWQLLRDVYRGEVEPLESPLADSAQGEFEQWSEYVQRIEAQNPGWYSGNRTASCLLTHCHTASPSDSVQDAPATGGTHHAERVHPIHGTTHHSESHH